MQRTITESRSHAPPSGIWKIERYIAVLVANSLFELLGVKGKYDRKVWLNVPTRKSSNTYYAHSIDKG